jgi:hypothetical protein
MINTMMDMQTDKQVDIELDLNVLAQMETIPRPALE